jgi:hypothetical protein
MANRIPASGWTAQFYGRTSRGSALFSATDLDGKEWDVMVQLNGNWVYMGDGDEIPTEYEQRQIVRAVAQRMVDDGWKPMT